MSGVRMTALQQFLWDYAYGHCLTFADPAGDPNMLISMTPEMQAFARACLHGPAGIAVPDEDELTAMRRCL